MEKLYHVSTLPNLKILEPRVSSHGKPYVYATKDLTFSLLFGTKKSFGDLDGMYGQKNGIPFFYEAYEGAFKRRFEGEKCFIYEVETTTFKEGLTSFRGEVVSEEPVKVINCEEVKDVYAYLREEIKKGKLELKTYSRDNEYQDMIIPHIKRAIQDQIRVYDLLNKPECSVYKFCMLKFPAIMGEFSSRLTND